MFLSRGGGGEKSWPWKIFLIFILPLYNMNTKELISYYRSIDIEKNIMHKRRSAEENVKTKLLLPLMEFLGYDLVRDIDYERKHSLLTVSTFRG